MENKKTTSISFGPGAYSILKNLPGSLVGMFCEFIDNSIASYIKNKEKLEDIEGGDFKLKIRIEKLEDTIIITDNAAGINERDFQRALQPANKPEDVSGLNEFGMGMKYAAVWLSNEWELHSSALGENVKRQTIFNYDKVINEQLESLPIIEKNKDKNEHGTKVILRYLEAKHVHRFPNELIKKKLCSIYRNYLRPDGTFQAKYKKYDIEIMAFDEILNWEEFGFLKQQWYEDRQGKIAIKSPIFEWKHEIKEQPIEWDEEVMDRANSKVTKVHKRLVVSGFVGILPDGQHKSRNGFVITRRGRVIEGYDDRIFPYEISTRSARDFQYVRMYGELNFDEVEVSFDKSKLSISQETRDMCFQAISIELKNIIFPEDPNKKYNMLKQAKEHRAKFTREQVTKGINKFHESHQVKDTFYVDSELNEIGNTIFDKNYNEKQRNEITNIEKAEIVPQEFSKILDIENESWTIKLNWINQETCSFLYNVNPDYTNKTLMIYLNMANEVVINNPTFKEDVNFMDIILCLGISELKAIQGGAENAEFVRYAFNDYIKILKA
jgi:hypothetical protein